MKNELRWVTSVCCQWRDSASYDRVEVIETFVLRGKFNEKIAAFGNTRNVTCKPKKQTE
ncbi:MAG TPA: hypothetical protein GXZ51_04860 [Acholeplasma sp.]|nr:hypothetical protein [Lutibacter sp.]HHU21754.1 hypothetical protein [Acholeplasma sp.]